jgi:uncharacterized protein DUF1194
MFERWLSPAAAPSGHADVDLALILAIDASGSMTDERFALQLKGYAQAFLSAPIVQAVQAGPLGRIAATVVEWSGAGRQSQPIGWTVIEDERSARAFSSAVAETPAAIPDWTSISGAIDFSVKLFAAGGLRAARRVIDISGDGASNDGRDVVEARDDAVAAGITINGLPILASEANLDVYYRDNVIGGPGAFLVVADDLASFADAVARKLLNEITAEPRLRGRVG